MHLVHLLATHPKIVCVGSKCNWDALIEIFRPLCQWVSFQIVTLNNCVFASDDFASKTHFKGKCQF
jgi:hypothetical protein